MRNLVAVILLLLPSVAFSGEAKPLEIVPYIHAQVPHGTGSLGPLWITVYDAALWLDAPSWSMEVPFALSLRYHMGFGSDELVERTVQEMQRIPGVAPEALESYATQLRPLFPDVQNGDRITAIYVPKKGTRFYHNDRLTGHVTDPLFAQSFFAIWLGPDTSEPKLRRALLHNPPS